MNSPYYMDGSSGYVIAPVQNAALKLAQPQGNSALHQYLMGSLMKTAGKPKPAAPAGTVSDATASYAPESPQGMTAQYGGYAGPVTDNTAVSLAAPQRSTY